MIYTADLEGTRAKIEGAGALAVDEIIHFPGGRRFKFTDPNGNVLAVWTE